MSNFKEARKFTGRLIMAAALLTPGAASAAREVDTSGVNSTAQTLTDKRESRDYTSSFVVRRRYEPHELVWVDKGDRAVLSVDFADRKIDTVTCFEVKKGFYCKEETYRVDKETYADVRVGQRNFSPRPDQLDPRSDYDPTGVSVRYDTQVVRIAKGPQSEVWIDQGDHAVRGIDDSDVTITFRKSFKPDPFEDRVHTTEVVRVKDSAEDDFRIGEKGVYVNKDQIKQHDTNPNGKPLFFKEK